MRNQRLSGSAEVQLPMLTLLRGNGPLQLPFKFDVQFGPRAAQVEEEMLMSPDQNQSQKE